MTLSSNESDGRASRWGSADGYTRYEIHYHRMGNKPPDWDEAAAHPERYHLRKPWLPSDRSARICDVGCGWGYMLMCLWSMGYRNLWGIENSEAQGEIAANAAAGRATILLGDAQELLREMKGQFDLVLLLDVLEHLPTHEQPVMLASIFEALSPGGCLVVRVPNAASVLSAYSRYLDITHKTMFTEFSLMQLLDTVGFQEHRIVEDEIGVKWNIWRPWKPWKGLSILPKLNHVLHRALYSLRGQYPRARPSLAITWRFIRGSLAEPRPRTDKGADGGARRGPGCDRHPHLQPW